MGALGFGNLLAAGFDVNAAYIAVRNLVIEFTSTGILVILELPTGTLNSTGSDSAWGQQVVTRLTELARFNEQFVIVDPTQWSIDPSTGAVFSKYLRTIQPGQLDDVHPNRLS